MMVNTEATNTRRMREHQLQKRQDVTLNKYEEIDLGVASTVVNFVTSCALNARIENAALQAVVQANPNGVSLVSDADEQLILKLVFKDPVTVTQLVIRADKSPAEGLSETVSGPKTLKLYANRDDLDFSEVEDVKAAQEAALTPTDLESEARITLRGNRFQRINSLQIFIGSNQDDSELTFVNRVALRGFINSPYHQQHLIAK